MSKTIRRGIGVLLLAIAIAMTQIPVSDAQAEGNSAADFKMDNNILVEYTGTSQNVSVPSGVKEIGEDAFAGHVEIRTITFPDSLKTIRYNAFKGCNGLVEVSLPDSVEEIGNAAFSECSSLQKVSLGAGLNTLGSGVFAGCYNLNNVTISLDNNRFVYENGMILDWKKAVVYQRIPGLSGESVVIPASVTKIKDYSFWGCLGIKEITLSGAMEEISAYAFSNCKNLEKVTIPYSVHRIDIKAFEDCVSLANIVIPPSVTNIHSTAFDGCSHLEIVGEPGTYAYTFGQSWKEANSGNNSSIKVDSELDDSERVVKAEAEAQPEPQVVAEPDPENMIGKTSVVAGRAFVFVDNSGSKVYNGNERTGTGADVVVNSDDSMNTSGMVNGYNAGNVGKGKGLPKYTIVDDRIVADQAYYNAYNLKDFQIPSSIKEIGKYAFARSGLKSITIPNGVTSIDYCAFYHCDDLVDVQIPSSVQDIGTDAFEKTMWLETWKDYSSNDILVVGDGILLAYKGNDASYTIPNGVKKIASSAFKGHTELTQIVIPDSVIEIGEEAFMDCTNLSEVVGGDKLLRICDRAFYGCNLQTVYIADSVHSIGVNAFTYGNGIREGVVVFKGNIPGISCGDTTSKLDRPELRKPVFEGYNVAIAPYCAFPEMQDMFINPKLGFRGAIGKFTDDTQGDLGVIAVSPGVSDRLADSHTGTHGFNINYPSDDFELTGKEVVQDGYIWLNGASAFVTDYTKSSCHLQTPVQEGLSVEIIDSASAENDIENAYGAIYGGKKPAHLHGFEMNLCDASSSLHIHDLGNNTLYVSLRLPDDVSETNLHAVCTDDNGQLEEIEYSVFEVEGEKHIQLALKHLSYVGIYNYSDGIYGSGLVTDGNAVVHMGNKDNSPDTGDHSLPIQYVVAIFTAALGLFLIVYKGRRKIS